MRTYPSIVHRSNPILALRGQYLLKLHHYPMPRPLARSCANEASRSAWRSAADGPAFMGWLPSSESGLRPSIRKAEAHSRRTSIQVGCQVAIHRIRQSGRYETY